MFKFFASIADLIATVVGYVVAMFQGLILLIVRAVQAFAYILAVLNYLPAYLKGFVIGMIAVSILLFVINKGDS